MFSRLAHFSLALALTAIPAAQGINITALFGPSLSKGAEIFLPIESNYAEDVTQRWTLHDAPSYLGAIQVATEGDVQNIVRIASKNSLPFLATGGGHGTTVTLGNLRQGLEIDLSKLNTVSLDAGSNCLTVGGGTRFSDVISPLYAAGKEMQIGTATCVGMIGATLSGGVSSLQGKHGLLIDTLLSVRLITAAGDDITVSKEQNADLFWALRGAGANFGIVTSATYKVFDATNGGQVLSTNFEYFASANRSIWEILKSFDNKLPPNLALNIAVQYSPPDKQSGFIVNANYFGPQEEGLSYLQPFIDLKPVIQSVKMVNWTGVFADAYFGLDTTGCVKGQYVNAYTEALKQTDVGTLESFFADLSDFSATNFPSIRASLVIHRFPTQAVLAVPDNDTVYPYRDIKMHVQLESSYAGNSSTLENTVNTFSQSVRSKLQPTSGYPSLAVYLGFAHGDEGPSVWYSPRKLGRLTSLKRQWDPKQLFSWYNAVPL